MWRAGDFYWGKKISEDEGNSEGIVVVFAWMLSKRRNLEAYVNLFYSLRWDSLVTHSHLLNLFFPSQATSLALVVLDELSKEVAKRPRPIVFATFSGGSKSCMYKLFQILQERCEEPNVDSGSFNLVRKCVAGQIYDSSPIDFISELGANFVVHPTVLKLNHPPRVLRWGAQATAWALDALFLSRFEAQRAEHWQILYSSVNMGPVLLLCSEDDDLAPFETICNFASHMRELGGQVKMVAWKSSPHVGHYRDHPEEYRDAVVMHLSSATSHFSARMGKLLQQGTTGGQSYCNSKVVCDADEVTADSLVTRQMNLSTLTSCPQVQIRKHIGSYADGQKEELIDIVNFSSSNAEDMPGKLPFDIDMPKYIEDWEIKSSSSSLRMFNRSINARAKSGSINPTRFIRRCRL
ncbi:hypothetical protein SUGI_0854250 [Cryptomeria japonica]|uniref:uncharacterized protein LOC131055930 n=1 Tax=Cryptomeria japonica TaxID=3369 RepID=UPI00241471C1|nr:uncharacterized protein LOC131055930 [Cryptomeria japonica]GLJ41265.1 hypothetical protein SUGI_0854250 [Cryptomeria japonica]